MSYKVRTALMLMDWDKVRRVLLDTRKITVVTANDSRKFQFRSNTEAKIALNDWLNMPNARPALCQGVLEFSLLQ